MLELLYLLPPTCVVCLKGMFSVALVHLFTGGWVWSYYIVVILLSFVSLGIPDAKKKPGTRMYLYVSGLE